MNGKNNNDLYNILGNQIPYIQSLSSATTGSGLIGNRAVNFAYPVNGNSGVEVHGTGAAFGACIVFLTNSARMSGRKLQSAGSAVCDGSVTLDMMSGGRQGVLCGIIPAECQLR